MLFFKKKNLYINNNLKQKEYRVLNKTWMKPINFNTDRTGDTLDLSWDFVFSGIGIQLNVKLQSNLPTCISLTPNHWYSNVSSRILSITGATTCSFPSAILPNKGSSQPGHTNTQNSKTQIFVYPKQYKNGFIFRY